MGYETSQVGICGPYNPMAIYGHLWNCNNHWMCLTMGDVTSIVTIVSIVLDIFTWNIIWGFPETGGTPKLMVYKGKSYLNG